MKYVLLVDDHEVTRRGVRELLAEAYAGLTFGEACDGVTLAANITAQPWDLVVLDAMLPGSNMLTSLAVVRAARPALPVLVLTAALETEFVVQAIDRIAELRSFVALPDEAALIRFACESLLPPTVSSKSRGDPQVRQIRNALNPLIDKGKPVRVLDFGAGRGRLLEGLVSTNGVAAIQKQLDYLAFDAWDTHRSDCLRTIANVYPAGPIRYFNTFTTFHEECEDHSVGVIVLCNVLHELPVADWTIYFGPNGAFSRMLAPRGVVLVVEDHKMRVGEHAHRHGFLLFGTGELKKLFSVTEADCAKGLFSVFSDSMRPDRIRAHAVSRSLIERFSIATARSALASLRDSAQENVRQVRQNKSRTTRPGLDEGQDHARWVHLFANASLALAEISAGPRRTTRAKTKKARTRN